MGGEKEGKGRGGPPTAFWTNRTLQLAYMIYITNAKARINILSITASCR